MQYIARQIHEHVKGAKKIVIIPHQHPDGDAIGAATALHEYLNALGKSSTIFCVTPVNERLRFVPHSTALVTDPEVLADKAVDTVMLVDSGDLRYAGVDQLLANHPATIINIDHHATNERYGHINLVLPTAASTTEILYHFFRHNTIVINHKMATSLLTGLTTDTGNFTNAATSATALLVGGELIRAGGNFKLINDAVTKNKTVNTLRLWGEVFSRLQKNEELGITYTYLTRQDLAAFNVNESESEGIANFMNNLENTKIALILKEVEDGKFKGSFRTTHDDVDVAALAQQLGGGGHKKAAGFTVEGPIEKALEKILQLAGNKV